MFFRLPTAVLVHFLSEWLDIYDVGRLDTAMTTRAVRSKFLQYLQDMRSITVNAHERLKKSCSFLTWLSCRRIFVKEMTVWDLDTSVVENLEFPFLRRLSILDSFLFNIRVPLIFNTNMINLVNSCPSLQSFSIFAYRGTFHEILRRVADNCPMLEELNLNCKFVVEELIYLLNKCSALTKFSLSDPDHLKTIFLPVAGNFWDSNNWECLRPYGHLIHHIGVYGNPPALAGFLDACPRLHELSCTNSDDTISGGMILLRAAKLCPLLENLALKAYTSAALLEISRNCKKLRKLTFFSTSSRLGLPVTDLTFFNQLETLEELRLGVKLTSELITVLSGFRNLKVLDLDELDNVDSTFANVKLAGTPISRSLEKIKFYGDKGVIPIAFLSCFSACTNLQVITLDRGCRCDDACFEILATHFPLLKKITLNYIKEHVDGLKIFVAQSKQLKRVFLMLPRHYYGYGYKYEMAHADFQRYLSHLRSSFPHIRFDDSR